MSDFKTITAPSVSWPPPVTHAAIPFASKSPQALTAPLKAQTESTQQLATAFFNDLEAIQSRHEIWREGLMALQPKGWRLLATSLLEECHQALKQPANEAFKPEIQKVLDELVAIEKLIAEIGEVKLRALYQTFCKSCAHIENVLANLENFLPKISDEKQAERELRVLQACQQRASACLNSLLPLKAAYAQAWEHLQICGYHLENLKNAIKLRLYVTAEEVKANLESFCQHAETALQRHEVEAAKTALSHLQGALFILPLALRNRPIYAEIGPLIEPYQAKYQMLFARLAENPPPPLPFTFSDYKQVAAEPPLTITSIFKPAFERSFCAFSEALAHLSKSSPLYNPQETASLASTLELSTCRVLIDPSQLFSIERAISLSISTAIRRYGAGGLIFLNGYVGAYFPLINSFIEKLKCAYLGVSTATAHIGAMTALSGPITEAQLKFDLAATCFNLRQGRKQFDILAGKPFSLQMANILIGFEETGFASLYATEWARTRLQNYLQLIEERLLKKWKPSFILLLSQNSNGAALMQRINTPNASLSSPLWEFMRSMQKSRLPIMVDGFEVPPYGQLLL